MGAEQGFPITSIKQLKSFGEPPNEREGREAREEDQRNGVVYDRNKRRRDNVKIAKGRVNGKYVDNGKPRGKV